MAVRPEEGDQAPAERAGPQLLPRRMAGGADGLPRPWETALRVAEAPPEAAEHAVLVRGRTGALGTAALGLRQFCVKALARLRELWPRQLNLSWVTDSLAVGGAFRPEDVRRLRAQGITAVVDLRAEACDDAALLARHGIVFLHLPTPDAHPLPLEDLERGVEWVLAQQAAGRKVLVHCMHGAGRGPLLGAAVLVACGYRASDALRLLRARRWQAVPNARQLEVLRAYELRQRRA
ncbi:MAG TPA: dual specificity protein phosphatase family protein [Chloroflexota bacterium]|nr:dual specificity protein phosphatase family protein [Chloroflexota bacterium]